MSKKKKKKKISLEFYHWSSLRLFFVIVIKNKMRLDECGWTSCLGEEKEKKKFFLYFLNFTV